LLLLLMLWRLTRMKPRVVVVVVVVEKNITPRRRRARLILNPWYVVVAKELVVVGHCFFLNRRSNVETFASKNACYSLTPYIFFSLSTLHTQVQLEAVEVKSGEEDEVSFVFA
jgi:hypothetical protein